MQTLRSLKGVPSKRVRGRWFAGPLGIATLMAFLVLPVPPVAASASPIVLIVMENTSYSKIVGSSKAPFINSMIAGGLSFTNYFDNIDGSLHNYLAMTDGNVSTNQAPPLENIFHQLQSTSTSWATYEESMPSACYTGTSSGTVLGSTDGLYVKIHNPAMYFNNINGDPSACANVLPLTTATFDPDALPAFSYVVPNDCDNMHTQSTGTCPAYFGTNANADKITMADSWLATFVPAIASKATVILTWDEGSFTSPQQIPTVEYGLGVSGGTTNNDSFNHFNLLAGLESFFGVPAVNGAIGQTPLPIPSPSPPPVPTITSFTPISGVVGSSVTITGTGFIGASDVRFNGTSVAGNFTVDSDTQITAIVPAGATDGFISVDSPGGTATSADPFTVTTSPPPTITGFSPPSGPVGTSVTINGSGFIGASDVQFNGTSVGAGHFTVGSDIQITATVPAGATDGFISVVTPGGTATSADPFTVIPSPTITSFSPPSGPVATSVTINGTGFTGASDVRFNGTSVAGTFTVGSDIQITATVPAGATTGFISVDAPGGTATSADPFTVIPPPTITGFSPPSGPVGTSVTINGSGFTGASDVQFNGLTVGAGHFTVGSDIQITATVPAGATTGLITVVTPGGSANSATSFTVSSGPLPTITSFSPTSGPVGTIVVILGTNFTSTSVVKFNGVTGTNFVFRSTTKVKATVPTGATTGPISVTTASGTGTSATNFTVPSGPTITSFSPTSGPVGTIVVILGTSFTGATVVKFNGVIATFTVNSPTKITATVPAGATTGKIIVKTPAGKATSLTKFTVT